MSRLEPFLFCEAFPSPAPTPTKENFFHNIIFLVTFGVLEDSGKITVDEVIYEKEYFSLSIFTFCRGVSLVFGFSSQAYQGNKGLAPT